MTHTAEDDRSRPGVGRGGQGARVVRNVGLNFLTQAWFAVLAIVTTPFIVRGLGADAYGIYVIVSAVMGYFSFLDLGLGSALVKYVAEFDAADDRLGLERVIRTGAALFLLLGSVGAAAIALLTSVLVDSVLTVPAQSEGTARVAFYLAALAFLVNLPSQTFGVIPIALQRFDVVALRTFVLGTLSIGSTLAVLALGRGLEAVLVANLVITVITAASFYTKTRGLLPSVSFVPRFFRSELRLLLGFGALKAVQRVTNQLVFQLDSLVVGAFSPIAAVAYYSVPLALSQRAAGVVSNVGAAVFPAASALSGQGDGRRTEELYLRAMKLTVLLALPLSSIMFVYSAPILRYWLSDEFAEKSATVLMILAVANLLFSCTTIPAVILDATGRIRVSTSFGLLAAGVNVILMFTLVPTIGITGAAWAVLGNASMSVPLLLYYVHTRVLAVGLRVLLLRVFARPVAAAAITLPLMVLARPYPSNLLEMAGMIVVTVLCYFVAAVLAGAVDRRDRAVVWSLVRR